jgi:hypothetical protein
MSFRLAALALSLPACIGGITTGAIVPLGPAASTPLPASTAAAVTPGARYTNNDAPAGVELRIFGATGGYDHDPLMPNAYGVAYRQIGDEHVQTAGQVGWGGAWRIGKGFMFGRLMFDLLSSQRTLDGDRKFSAFSPTFDFGVAPVRNGLCFSLSATYDVHFNDPDRVLVGAFVGVCASDRGRSR